MNRRPASRTASSHTPSRSTLARGMLHLLSLCSMVAGLAYTPCALANTGTDTDTELMAPPGNVTSGVDPSDPPASAPGPADPVTAGPDGLGGAVFNPFAIGTPAARSPGVGATQAPAPDEGDLTWAITSCIAGLLAFAGLLRRVWNG